MCRIIGTFQPMNEPSSVKNMGNKIMEILIPLAVVVAWVVLQVWVLPRFGVKT
jgi:hypothetical protein